MNPTTDRKTNAKVMQFSGELYAIMEQQLTRDALTNSELYDVIEAIVLKAIYYGKTIE